MFLQYIIISVTAFLKHEFSVVNNHIPTTIKLNKLKFITKNTVSNKSHITDVFFWSYQSVVTTCI